VPMLTLSRAVAVLHGVPLSELQQTELTSDAKRALKALLESEGLELNRPINVRELPELQGFHLAQPLNDPRGEGPHEASPGHLAALTSAR
jgi:hypothetical protein